MAHILIVEDEAHIAQMIEATLSLGGYTSEICSDGAKAVERILAGGQGAGAAPGGGGLHRQAL